ncbi:hypothetical protein GE061_002240 [Apolygus lucorum]|uniref:carbonyl reductase (NADPH) n=1 Tax=Apolygus lucorum TaxID=248454 RepID=A0A6A4JHG4_APOLU|nr:hypothetical protein GE061_002240 [Apolygus lucorum]
MSQKVAVVTGSNKGIGFATVRNLCSQFDGIVYLTARDEDRGKRAVEELNKEGLKPAFHKLDIDDKSSIDKFAAFIKEKHGGLDVLVNNAAILIWHDSPEPLLKQAEETLKTNYYALKDVCNALFPLLRPHARVVTVSSAAGFLQRINNEELRSRYADPNLTVEDLDKLVQEYIEDVKAGTQTEKGYSSPYSVSKIAASALARIQQKKFLEDPREDIVINHVHPGFVDTDLVQHKGPLTIEEGSVASTYAALLPKNCESPKGEYLWYDKQIVDWVTGGNRGIGLAIVKRLCLNFDGTVYLTSRDEEKGKKAADELNKDGLYPIFQKLDVDDKNSIEELATYIKMKHGGLDILINNAAMLPRITQDVRAEYCERMLKTNYYAVKNVCNALFPLLRPHARVVNVSSEGGYVKKIPGEDLQKKFADPELTEEALDDLVQGFITDVEDGTYVSKGWPTARSPPYNVSKVSLNALSRIYHKRFLEDQREDIIINFVHPGRVDSRNTGREGLLTTMEGAEAPVYAALLPENTKSPKGCFLWHNTQVVDWINGPLPEA